MAICAAIDSESAAKRRDQSSSCPSQLPHQCSTVPACWPAALPAVSKPPEVPGERRAAGPALQL